MPIADMAGAAANRIGVARDLGRYNQGQKDQLLGGISAVGDLGAAAVEAQHRAKMEQLLQEQGFDPATAKNLIAAGPHATASALLQKKRDAQQREQQLADVQSQRTWQETQTEGSRMFEQGQQDRQNAQQIMLHGLETPEQKYRREQNEALKQARQQSSMVTEPSAPTPLFTNGPSNLVEARQRAATAPEFESSMLGLGFNESAPENLRPPKATKAPELSPYEEMLQRLRAQKEMGAGDFKPEKPVKPEPYKPMTREEQIQFDADKAAATRVEPRDPNANVDAVERLKRRMSVDDQTEFERLFNGAKQGPFGTAPTPESVASFKEFVAAMMKKYPDAAPRAIGVGVGAQGASQPPGDPKKVQALQAAGWTWDGTKWNEPAK